MRISLIQSKLHWENSALNLRMFSEQLADLAGKTDLVVLPEMFTTGFSMHPQRLAETMDGPTMKWLSQTAQELDSAVTGSFICVENGKYYNRLVFMFPDGAYETYDKRHLFSLAGEEKVFTSGNKKLVVTWKGFRICPLICYDLRFPVWSRNLDVAPYDLLIYVANWPNRRSHHWR
ncbi:MAG: nitrilase family protein, partial [Saprospiraceae bacterium]|nr:nitrilase family protein [Saprospiraceae bacterium]